MDRGDDEAELGGKMTTQRTDAIQHLPALFLIDQRDELEADLEGQLLDLEQAGEILAGLRIGGIGLRAFACLAVEGIRELGLRCRNLARDHGHATG